jgi:HK97 family phage major capsid protein
MTEKNELIQEVKSGLTRLELSMSKNREELQAIADQATGEVKKLGTVTAETSAKLQEVIASGKSASEGIAELRERMRDIEQKGAQRSTTTGESAKSVGEIVTASADYQAVQKAQGKVRSMEAVTVGSFHKTAIVNATGQNQPLVPADRVSGIIVPGQRRLTVRDLFPVIPTQSNLIEFASESGFTNNAAGQYSSPNFENVSKAESAMTFTLDSEAVQTIAHFIPASRQVLTDAPMLAAHINSRLTYGLKLKEETQLLLGDATGANLNGVVTQASAYDHNVSASPDTLIDTLLRAVNQVALSEYMATGIVIHPTTWTDMRLLKDANGNYIFGDPQSTTDPMLWGLPVVATQSMTANHFLVGAFALGGAIFDREDATVRIAEQHSDFFVKNMVAILAEERTALVIYRPTAFVTGTFDR